MSDAARVVERVVERVWYGDDALARVGRVALMPASFAYGGIVRARGALQRAGLTTAHALALPALSVGNITVGGTGKTPVAAWLAARLQRAGARPAIVMRGYGDDEPLVHALLTPGVDVVVDADRVRGTATAARRGADVAVLDDAFQHWRARRDADVVLVAAERMREPVRLLPAGPYREPLRALRRATAIVITRKSASTETADAAMQLVARAAPHVPLARIALALDELRAWPRDVREPLGTLAGQRVLAIAAVGDPRAFHAQLEALGAAVDGASFADHHAFDDADVRALARRAEGVDRVVCTLKDAVKLGPLWPRLAPVLWYVSQRVVVERGDDVLNQLVARLLAARTHRHVPLASAGLSDRLHGH